MPDEEPTPSVPARILPAGFLAITPCICDRVLNEQDGVVSAMRFVDLFYLTPQAFEQIRTQQKDKASSSIQAAVQFYVLISTKLEPDDTAEHIARFALIKADGEIKRIGDPHKITAPPSKISGAPRGFNIIAQMNVIPTSLGTAFIQVVIDEHEIARLPFTVAVQEQQSQEGNQ